MFSAVSAIASLKKKQVLGRASQGDHHRAVKHLCSRACALWLVPCCFSFSSPRGKSSSPQRQRGGGLPAPLPINKKKKRLPAFCRAGRAGRKRWTPQHVPPSHPEPKATVHPCTVRALTQDAVSFGYKVHMRKNSADVVNSMCRRYVTRHTILCRGFYLKKCDRAALDVDCSRTDVLVSQRNMHKSTRQSTLCSIGACRRLMCGMVKLPLPAWKQIWSDTVLCCSNGSNPSTGSGRLTVSEVTLPLIRQP